MEFKCVAHNFNGTLFPVMQILYVDNGTPTTIHEFDMNGDYHYADSLIHGFDAIDDFAALRAIKTKPGKNGAPIYDPDTLKFLQDDKGLFS